MTYYEFIEETSIAALNGMLAHSTRYKPRSGHAGMHWHDAISKEAFEIAEAMAKARRKCIGDFD